MKTAVLPAIGASLVVEDIPSRSRGPGTCSSASAPEAYKALDRAEITGRAIVVMD